MAKGHSIRLVSFSKVLCDEDAALEVLQRCPGHIRNSVQLLFYRGGNLQKVLDTIRNAHCLIASRFHAMVLGLSFGVPVLPVPYSPKTTNVLADLNCQQYGISSEQLDKHDIGEESFLILSEEQRERLCLDSADTFRKLDEFLD